MPARYSLSFRTPSSVGSSIEVPTLRDAEGDADRLDAEGAKDIHVERLTPNEHNPGRFDTYALFGVNLDTADEADLEEVIRQHPQTMYGLYAQHKLAEKRAESPNEANEAADRAFVTYSQIPRWQRWTLTTTLRTQREEP